MCAKWRKGYDHSLILNAVTSQISPGKNGKLTIKIPYLVKWKPVLTSAVDFEPDIPEAQKENIITSALLEAIDRSPVTTDSLKNLVTKYERRYRNRTVKSFVLATSISFRKMPPFRKVNVGDESLVFSRFLPAEFNRKSAEEVVSRTLPKGLPTDYVALRVATSGRCEHEAAERALESLSLIMGIWNFILTRGTFALPLGLPNSGPIASLRLGPLHTLHNLDGSIATETFWHEPSYSKPARGKDFSGRFPELRKSEKFILKTISNAKNGKRLRSSFMRYAAAVDDPSPDSAFLRFWSILEHLTDTGMDSYDKTVRRASFIYENPLLARQELQHLREVRTRLVHLAESSNNTQTHVYQLKRHVDELLDFLLRGGSTVLEQQEMNEFLDLPTDSAELKRRVGLYERAIAFRRPTK